MASAALVASSSLSSSESSGRTASRLRNCPSIKRETNKENTCDKESISLPQDAFYSTF